LFFFIHFHPLFTCSFPYCLSANFGCFLFIHSLLVLSLIAFLPILVVFFSSTLYLFFTYLAFCQFWLFFFHPLSSTLWGGCKGVGTGNWETWPQNNTSPLAICKGLYVHIRAGSFLALL
jgi:hypothetical protein